MEEIKTPSKIDMQYAEEGVCFSIRDCSLDKKHSFWYLDNKEKAKRFRDKLAHIEKLKWKEWASIRRENCGLSKEDFNNPNFDLIDSQNTHESKLVGERYYFHFRIEADGLFRVFGYQQKQFFCITHIDPDGKINH